MAGIEQRIPTLHAAAADKRRRYFDEADEIEIPVTRLTEAVPATDAHLILVASDSADSALGQTGAYGRDLAKAADEVAVELAHQRAAELVGKKWDSDGNLVDNPDARFAISDTTRTMIRDVIEQGFSEQKTVDEIAADLMESGAFSEARAEMIARYEVSSINNDSALAAYKVARDDGNVALKKTWETSGGDMVCDDCLANEAAGEIDLDDDFPSGDDSPPLHVRCECNVVAVESDEGEDQDTD